MGYVVCGEMYFLLYIKAPIKPANTGRRKQTCLRRPLHPGWAGGMWTGDLPSLARDIIAPYH